MSEAITRSRRIDAARLLPDDRIRSSAGLGTPEEIVPLLRRSFGAGVDEIVLHGSPPAGNAPVRDARRRARVGR